MKRFSLMTLFVVGNMIFSQGIAHADNLPVNASTNITSQIPNVGLIWRGEIPTSINFPSDAFSGTLEFPIQGILPFNVLADKAEGVEVDFEIWSPLRKKLGSSTIYSFDWNPVGPNTLVDVPLYSDASLYGTQTMIIKTIYTTNTNGLLSRYLEDDQRTSLIINQVVPPKAPDAPTQLAGNFNGTTGNFTFTQSNATPPITKYEIGIASLISPNLSRASTYSFGTKTILNTTNSTSFSVTPDDVLRYFSSGYATVGTSSVLITVRANNSVGTSDWSNGIYMTTAQLGISPKGLPTPQSTPTHPYTVVVPETIPAKSSTRTLTISCTKGKSIKTVKGTSPKCPVGYKKK